MGINRELLRKNTPTKLGEEIHINHEGCSAGTDSKRRLCIKRVVGGTIGFCYHCWQGGYAADRGTLEGDHLRKWLLKYAGEEQGVTRGISHVTRSHDFPVKGLTWLRTYQVDPTNEFGEDDGYFFATGKDTQIGIELFSPDGVGVGFQIRNLAGSQPKYLTHYHARYNGDAGWYRHDEGNPSDHRGLVITEDCLSAYRVCRDSCWDAVALLKTTATEHTLQTILSLKYKVIVIWLDPDAAGEEGRIKLYERLKFILPATTKIRAVLPLSEPKACSPTDIRTILRE